jgi:hypothetical protein
MWKSIGKIAIQYLASLAIEGVQGRRNSSGGGRYREREWANTPTLNKLGRKYHHD